MQKNYLKLRGRIVEIYGNQKKFSEKIKTSRQTISYNLNGKRNFTEKSIILWANALKIPESEIGSYFYAEKLDKKEWH